MHRKFMGLGALLLGSAALAGCTESEAQGPLAPLKGRWKSDFVTDVAGSALQPCRDAYLEFRHSGLYVAGKAAEKQVMAIKSASEKDGMLHLVVRDANKSGQDIVLVLNVNKDRVSLDDAKDANGKISLKEGMPGLPPAMSKLMASAYEMLDRIFSMERCSS